MKKKNLKIIDPIHEYFKKYRNKLEGGETGRREYNWD
jgi:hypothetical protein